ncbi:MAG TPA: biopolymer transporter ExbD [Armatimonadota bacterium]|nr:biopolymer transporter ExbD [Armatimonadota bacterium]
MRRRRHDDELFAEINIVPFTDVCLVLLIIFMITANFIAMGGQLNIELPQAVTALPASQGQVLVYINEAGEIYLAGEVVQPQELAGKLQTEAQDNPELVVAVSADRNVPYQRVVTALDAVRAAGVSYLALAAEMPEANTQ